MTRELHARRLLAADWRGYRHGEIPRSSWLVENERFLVEAGTESIDLITRDCFSDFIFSFEWQVSAGGNSGVLYRVTEELPHAWQSGPEMQLLDDIGHPDGKNPLTCCGALYGILAPHPRLPPVANTFHRGRIVVSGLQVEHWIDDQRVVSCSLGSDLIRERIAASKFAEYPRFAQHRAGHIVLQHHHSAVCFRNLQVQPSSEQGQ